MRLLTLAACAAFSCHVAVAAGAKRDEVFLSLVKERHLGPVNREAWGRHVGDDCVWVGRGLRVVGRAEVQGLQIDTGKRVDIQDFVAHDYGDTAVLTYVVIEHQPQGGHEITTRLRKMDTYLSREGRWQLIANAEVVGKPDRHPVKLDLAVLDRYVGGYVTVFNGKPVRTRIWREGDHLFAQTEGQQKSELLPLSANEFFDAGEPEEGGATNVFESSAGGASMEWIYRDGAVEVRSKRTTPPAE
jgi:hypothetical protein